MSHLQRTRLRKVEVSPTISQQSVSRYRWAFSWTRAFRFWRFGLFASAVALALSLQLGMTTEVHAQFPATLELSELDGTKGFVINGVDQSDKSGTSVSGAGDVNGDGIDDIIIGAPDGILPGGGIRVGRSYVVFGNNTGFTAALELSSLSGSDGFVISGIDEFDQSGVVSGAGDVNGDGIDDVIIGGIRSGELDAGAGYVVYGSNTGAAASLDLSTLNGSNGFAISGADDFDRLGNSVSRAGDVNGDGIDDFIIAATPIFSVAPGETGEAAESYVVFGNDAGFVPLWDLNALDGTNGFAINGIMAGDGIVVEGNNSIFNTQLVAVSGAGDINGDGFDDIIVGAFGVEREGKDFVGESYVVFGNNAGFPPSLDVNTLDGTNGFVIKGVDALDFSGWSVSGVGDVNGDGIDDLIVAAPVASESYVVYGSNAGFAPSLDLSTFDSTNGFVINGAAGRSVSGAGDVNGDGIDDIIIGERSGSPGGISGAGKSYVVFGNSAGFALSFDVSTLNGTNGFVLNGNGEFASSGTSVSGAGDVNGDGIDDIIIGAPRADAGRIFSAGKSYVVFGQRTMELGDVDRDGAVNFLDISPFIGLLTTGEYQLEADTNEDNDVNFLDISPFIQMLSDAN